MNDADSTHRTAFVTGGSGFVGKRLIQSLVAQGWEVRALARSEAAMAAVRAVGAIAVPGGLGDVKALSQGMAGSEVVFHVAAHFKLWGERKAFDEVNVGGMQAIVEAATTGRSVRKVIAVSAAAVVMGDPEPILEADESLPLQTRSFAPYGSSKAEAEKVLLAANGRREGLETIAIRPPMIWGADMPMLDQMVETVKAGNWQWVDEGVQPTSTCHVDNLVEALILAADHGRGGEAYFVTDAETGTLKSILSDLLATRNVTASNKSVSFSMAWTIAGLMAGVWRLFHLRGEPPITRQMLRLIGKPFTIRYDKARRDLGYIPKVSWKQGIEQMSR
ncbi:MULTISPECIES: NAD-dependent epimerase/dehydratase family protein [Paraburkholderia]|uniref:NAD-dependent epimerase/dehydratase family protein n=1 Tax=Paraburkholderia TaxID=1822464 RepID=UPI00225C2194|nr:MULTISPECIES: NAD-dependent epimerase/dehydratase family protein [Paraburkholderia]MCX4160184.1 NAD-dependent epimerase/dehydratase family protein [Paraburkholderia megapolitana]MDN7155683.1 NAD-dependent epimerase/dehydratase family protein [Paraburkholderia sp. CHISQ3]MDQ6492727.1 NAD-dependent epimerase/dehydratase family protein [Paraburkholderia megapolitana]